MLIGTTETLNENEMELLHNALYIYLHYLQGLNEGGRVSSEVGNIVIDTYVDAKALRLKLVRVAGSDLTQANADDIPGVDMGELLGG